MQEEIADISTLAPTEHVAVADTITFTIPDAGVTEMLKITKDGFYVRGVKLKQNRIEAKRVFKAFKSFLHAQGHLK